MTRLVFQLFCLSLIFFLGGALTDNHDSCPQWAASGECDNNPGYMLNNCAKSCDQIAKQALNDAKELEGIESFFDLEAKDIHGKIVNFSQFKGQVTLVVNVASECGYTDSHYRSLVKLYKEIDSAPINIMAFPCNQFGKQEPGTADEILEFVEEEYGVEFTMMEKVDVNGPNASIVYKFLKSKAGPSTITWNFATYFVIAPDGSVESHSGVEPLELKHQLFTLAKSGDEL
ncbi:glutathione S-transferase domain containing protein [Nitzschia inconspicua]|uniref:Glutathione S-transferase domain containing protein n=1 Tax=Nitzschia inconspicua TaxID=303405 RepID=A0A9K3KZR1_9STRA|nr:glutathione S-transferase domain containing protein [Nitzschia inconspicua]